MQNGALVIVELHGDPTLYLGRVIKAKKMWVELDPDKYPGGAFIADENCIKRWKPWKDQSESEKCEPK